MIGPILNHAYKRQNNRDPLGIDGISQSIVGELCPIVNSVTYHAIYWIFVNWIYYDLYENQKTTDMSERTLNAYIKKLNYFMILGNLLNDVDVSNMVGVDKIRPLDRNLESYSYSEDYIQTLTGINYYKAALTSAGFITYTDEYNNEYQHLKFTQKGKNLALSLDKFVTNTTIYKDYFLKNNYNSIPRNVIKEFGKIVSFNLEILEESKKLLKEYFFDTITKLSLQSKFIKYLYYDLKIENISDNGLRTFLYDYFSPRSFNNKYPDDLEEIIKGWELLVSRHYFTNSIEMIFNYVLEILTLPTSINSFVDKLTNDLSEDRLVDYVNSYKLNGEEINDILSYAKNRRNSHDKNIENAIIIMCSLYNRLKNRNDLNQLFLLLDNDNTSISLDKMLKDIDQFKDKSVKEFGKYIVKEYVINQHIKTAKRKMTLDEDSFFFGYYNEIIYGINRYDYRYDYQNLRINNLFQVMKELDMLGGK